MKWKWYFFPQKRKKEIFWKLNWDRQFSKRIIRAGQQRQQQRIFRSYPGGGSSALFLFLWIGMEWSAGDRPDQHGSLTLFVWEPTSPCDPLVLSDSNTQHCLSNLCFPHSFLSPAFSNPIISFMPEFWVNSHSLLAGPELVF